MPVRLGIGDGEARQQSSLERLQGLQHRLIWLIAGLTMLLVIALPRPAIALGIGSINLVSGPGEPLEARIALFPSSPDWADGLEAGLAAEAVFERVGIERQPELAALRFAIRVTRDGDPYIAVTTEQPPTVDFLSFVLEVRWFGGRVLREYTLLLEPPLLFAEDERLPAISSGEQPVDPGRGVIERSPPAPDVPPEPPAVVEAPAVETDDASPAAAETVLPRSREVIRNDTLWAIALETRPDDGVSVYQMMIALYLANRDAFINDNLNLVRAGAVLRIPDHAEISSLSADEARALFAGQVADWERMRAQARPPEDEDVAAGTTSAMSGDLLRVVAAGELAGETSGDAETAMSALDATRQLQNEVTSLQEREASLTAERDELSAMNQELMARVEALERVVNIEADPGLRDADAMTPAAIEPVPSEVPFWLDRRTHAALVLVVLFLLLLWVLRLRRERDEARLLAFGDRRDGLGEEDAVPRGAEPAAPARRASVSPVAAGDGSQSSGTGSERFFATFDPAGEAEYYVQRGETSRAEDLFDLALAVDETDAVVWLRKLKVLAEAGEADRYLDVAGRFRALLGADHPRWVDVQRLGAPLHPEHPWFVAVESAVDDTSATPPASRAESSAESAGDRGASARTWTDAFTLDSAQKPASTPDPVSAPNDDSTVIGEAVKSERGAAGQSAMSGSILTWSAGGAEAGSPRSARSRSLRQRPSQTLDGTLSPVQSGRRTGSPPATTPPSPRRSRLERARVYFERGDKEMGRHLLSEVLDSGSAEDRDAALRLLERYA